MHGDLDPAMSMTVSVAVQEILEQHDAYDVKNLCQFIRKRHAEIPEIAIPYVVTAATSAAWHVAKLFHVRERYMNSSDQQHQQLAENIARSLLAGLPA